MVERVTGRESHNAPHRLLPRRARRAAAAALAALAAAACGSAGGGSAGGSASGSALALTTAQDGLGALTDLAFLPDGRWVVTEKDGALKVRDTSGAVRVAGTFPVDTDSEKGLLGVAVDPAFATTQRLFVYYSASDAAGGTDLDRQRIVSVVLGQDGLIQPGRERLLVRGLRGPANHDGGALAIGPDGKLYAGVGDSGCNTGRPPEPPTTPGNFFATCLTNGNGKILRVDLDGAVPPDGPLSGVPAATACGATCGAAPGALAPPRTDLWAWGFRNPWRFWFDPATGLLWVGDVGEVSYEEITIARAGRHHGWPWREGAHGWPVSKCRETVPDTGDCVEPVYECRHGPAARGVDGDCGAITGGLIVDTARWPAEARGRYWFADSVNGRVWSVAVTADRRGVVPGSRREEARISGAPVALRLGPEGDLYLAVLPGRIMRLGPG